MKKQIKKKQSPVRKDVHFNISHHGSWVILVGCAHRPVGCDVITCGLPAFSNTVEEFAHSLREKVLTSKEWDWIHGSSTSVDDDDADAADADALMFFFFFNFFCIISFLTL